MKRSFIVIFIITSNLLYCFSQQLFTSWEQDKKRQYLLDTIPDSKYSQLDSLFRLEETSIIYETSFQRLENECVYSRSGSFSHLLVDSISPSNDTLPFLLIITDNITYDSIAYYIQRYAVDVHYGTLCGIKIEVVNNANFMDIKGLIINHANNLMGVTFIGDIDVPIYRISQYNDASIIERFPCDLYYMDINGGWGFDNNDTIISHTTQAEPEIFVGRISTSHMDQLVSHFEGLRNYFNKNHNYWLGKYDNTIKYALSYTDKDWSQYGYFANDVGYLYGNDNYLACIYDTFPNTSVTKYDYLAKISSENYSFVQLACHSAFTHHKFHNGNTNLLSSEIFTSTIKPIGINLFCCSACKWIDPHWNINKYVGGAYLFGEHSDALFVVGSTKTGSMLNFHHFYEPLGIGRCVGKALIDWWKTNCGETHNQYEQWWYNGLVILGDPMIQLNNSPYSCVDTINLTLFDHTDESNLHYFRAANTINVNGTFSIPIGIHVIFDAPNVNINQNFICPIGATFEIRNFGCE